MDDITMTLQSFFQPLGLEVHPFKVGWYNDAVSRHFKLDYDRDAIAFLVISSPLMFENGFLPYLKEKSSEPDIGMSPRDPLDNCMRHYFQEAGSLLSSHCVEIIHDFEILPNKRPKFLVQTAAHVTGAAYYYQKKDVEKLHSDKCQLQKNSAITDESYCDANNAHSPTHCDDSFRHTDGDNTSPKVCTCQPWGSEKRIYGVCIHPKYGGWFAIRGVIIVPDLRGNIQKKEPVDCVNTRELRIELLNRFNGNWQDWSFRDIISVSQKYSDLQKKYFATPPKERKKLISEIVNS